MALIAGKLLTEHPKRHAQRRTRKFAVRDPVGDHLDRQFLGVADGFRAGGSVRHHARQLKSFGDPPVVVFAVEFNRKIHAPSVARTVRQGLLGGSVLKSQSTLEPYPHEAILTKTDLHKFNVAAPA